MKKLARIVFEYDDSTGDMVEGDAAILFQSRVNSSGILSGIKVTSISMENLVIDEIDETDDVEEERK